MVKLGCGFGSAFTDTSNFHRRHPFGRKRMRADAWIQKTSLSEIGVPGWITMFCIVVCIQAGHTIAQNLG